MAETQNLYDQAARFALRRLDPAGFLRWLMPAMAPHWRWVDWLDSQAVPFPGEPDRRCDCVAGFELTTGGPPLALVVESETNPRHDMVERLADYASVFRQAVVQQRDPVVKYDVIGAVLFLTGRVDRSEWEVRPPHCDGLGSSHRVKIVNLAALDAAAVLADIAAGNTSWCLLAWVSLTQGGGTAAVIAEWKRLAEQQPESVRRELGGIVLTFAEKGGCVPEWKAALEGWNVEQSQVVLEWQRKAEVRQARRFLLDFLRDRFPSEVVTELRPVIDAQSDPDVLGRWVRLAPTASLADIQAAITMP